MHYSSCCNLYCSREVGAAVDHHDYFYTHYFAAVAVVDADFDHLAVAVVPASAASSS